MKYLLLILLSLNILAGVPHTLSTGEVISAQKINENFKSLSDRVDIFEHIFIKTDKNSEWEYSGSSYTLIPNREMLIEKKADGTGLYSLYSDVIRPSDGGIMCTIKIVIEDLNGNYVCSNSPIESNDYVNGDTNFYYRTIQGYCVGLEKGNYKAKVYLKAASPNGSHNGKCQVNWNGESTWILKTQELYIN